jgi:hypothetical protein
MTWSSGTRGSPRGGGEAFHLRPGDAPARALSARSSDPHALDGSLGEPGANGGGVNP